MRKAVTSEAHALRCLIYLRSWVKEGPQRTSLFCGHYKGMCDSFYGMSKGRVMGEKNRKCLQGTLDLMVLKTLYAWGHCTGLELRAGSSR